MDEQQERDALELYEALKELFDESTEDQLALAMFIAGMAAQRKTQG